MAEKEDSKAAEPAAAGGDDAAKAKKNPAPAKPEAGITVDKAFAVESAIFTFEAVRSAAETVAGRIMDRYVREDADRAVVLLEPGDREALATYRQAL